MKTYDIARCPKPVSQFVLGTDYFKLDNLEIIDEMMGYFLAIGGNTFDTANIYCNGESEQALGIWMEQTRKRKELVIYTKGAHHDERGPRCNPQDISHDVMTSLERLRVDFIELYGLHRDDPSLHVGVIIEALNEHIEAGRIGAIGGSNWTHQRIQEANDYASKHGLVGFAFNNPNLSLAKAQEPFWDNCVSADEHTVKWHTQTQLPLFSWSSQARGFFTDRIHPGNTEDKDLVRVFYNEANWQRRARAEQLALQKDVTVIQIALAYVLNHPFPTCALIGPRNEAEMKSCQAAANIVLTTDEMAWLVGS